MGESSDIEWTNATWNPWQGCHKVSPGCDNCYAENMSRRFGRNFGEIRLSREATFFAPTRWQYDIEMGRKPKTFYVFTCSISDFFHRDVPEEWLLRAWEVMASTPDIIYQVLTKRPGRAADWYKRNGWLPNVWLGTSVESQKYAKRLDVLARIPAPVRFASCEPMLGALDLGRWMLPKWWVCQACGLAFPESEIRKHGCPSYDGARVGNGMLDWVICGGESGRNARPVHPDWVGYLRDQCNLTKIPFFFKQWGEWSPNPETWPVTGTKSRRWLNTKGELQEHNGHGKLWPEVHRVGRLHSGAKLDGKPWREMP